MIELDLPYPPSTNRYFRIFRNRAVRTTSANRYKAAVIEAAEAAGVKCTQELVAVEIMLCPKITKRGTTSKVVIDLDNSLKVVLDALQEIAYWNDKQVREIHASYGPAQPHGGLKLRVWTLDPSQIPAGSMAWVEEKARAGDPQEPDPEEEVEEVDFNDDPRWHGF